MKEKVFFFILKVTLKKLCSLPEILSEALFPLLVVLWAWIQSSNGFFSLNLPKATQVEGMTVTNYSEPNLSSLLCLEESRCAVIGSR